MITLLFIDDDKSVHTTLRSLMPERFEIVSALTGKEGIRIIETRHIDLILLDINLPDMNGLTVLEQLSRGSSVPPVVMVSGYRDVPHVVKSLQFGAFDYVTKPYNFEELNGTIRNALQNSIRRDAVRPSIDHSVFEGFIGESEQIRKVKELVCLYAKANHTVLITGESGTGKELVARTIHALSHGKEGVYTPLNCGAIPPTLIESELFGSVRGAFTGAVDRKGCFERSHMGTLFLDEIGEMSLPAQVKLLRVLEEKSVTRVGGSKKIPVNVRVITATNKELTREVLSGNFRPDLYHRINVLPIHIPPLRERKEDIPLLTAYFLESSGHTDRIITPKGMEKLLSYHWPGNIRELRNVLHRSVIISGSGNIAPLHIVLPYGSDEKSFHHGKNRSAPVSPGIDYPADN